MDSRSSVFRSLYGSLKLLYYLGSWKRKIIWTNNFGGADNAKKGEQEYTFQKVWVQFI